MSTNRTNVEHAKARVIRAALRLATAAAQHERKLGHLKTARERYQAAWVVNSAIQAVIDAANALTQARKGRR